MFRGQTIVASGRVAEGQCFATRFEKLVWTGRINDLSTCPSQADTLHMSPREFEAINLVAQIFPKQWGDAAVIDGVILSRDVGGMHPWCGRLEKSWLAPHLDRIRRHRRCARSVGRSERCLLANLARGVSAAKGNIGSAADRCLLVLLFVGLVLCACIIAA
jgi:hypothetical protein